MLCVAQPAAAQAMFPLLGFIKEEQVCSDSSSASMADGSSLGSRCLLTPLGLDPQASGPSVVHSSYQAANNAAAAASAGLSQQRIQLEQSQLYAGLQAVSLAPASQGAACQSERYASYDAVVVAELKWTVLSCWQ